MKKSGRDEVFQRMLRENRMPHAVLFQGPQGSGKKESALFLARLLLCGNDKAKPCGDCDSCLKMNHDAHPDMTLVSSDEKTKSIRIDVIRNIKNKAQKKPVQSRRQVIIIRDAHHMNEAAQNALLKVLEEPPGEAVFILISDEPQSLRATVLSRLRKFSFVKSMEVDHDKSDDTIKLRDQALDFLLGSQSGARVSDALWETPKEKAPGLIHAMTDIFRDLSLIITSENAAERIRFADRITDLKFLAQGLSPDQVMDALEVLGQASEELDRKVNVRLVFWHIRQMLNVGALT